MKSEQEEIRKDNSQEVSKLTHGTKLHIQETWDRHNENHTWANLSKMLEDKRKM